MIGYIQPTNDRGLWAVLPGLFAATEIPGSISGLLWFSHTSQR